MIAYIKKLLKGQPVEWKTLGEVAEIEKGKQLNKELLTSEGLYPAYNGGVSYSGFTDRYSHTANTTIISQGGASAGFVNFVETCFYANAHCYVVIPNQALVHRRFIYYVLKRLQPQLMGKQFGAGIPALRVQDLLRLPVPVPPLLVQVEIVRILDKFTELEAELETELEAELEVRKQQYEHYRNSLLSYPNNLGSGGVVYKTLGEVTEYEQPSKYIVKSDIYKDRYRTPVLTPGKTFILGYTDDLNGIYPATHSPVILFDDFTSAFKWVDFDFKVKSSAVKMITAADEGQVMLRYIYYWMQTTPPTLVDGDHKRQWISSFSKKRIPIPPLAEQARVVAILDKFEALTNSLTEGLPQEIELRRKQYEYYREQLLSFPA